MLDHNENMRQVRERICDGTLLVLAMLSIPGLVGSLSRTTEIGIKPFMFFQFLAVITIWVSFVFRKRLPYWFRATFILFGIYLVAITGLMQFGLLAPGVWFVVIPVVSVILFSSRAGLGMALAEAVSFVVVAILFTKGYLTLDFNVGEYAISLPAWINQFAVYAIAAGIVLTAVIISTDSLEGALEETNLALMNRVSLQKISDGIITMDQQGVIATINPAAERLFGYETQEIIGRKAEILMPKKYRVAHANGIKRYFSGSRSRLIGVGPIELTGLKKNGELFPISLSIDDFVADGKKLVISIIRDITAESLARKESERTLAELTQLIDTANAPIFGIDAVGQVTEWNQSAVRISGFEKAEVLGRDLVQDFITEEYKASVKEVLDNALRGKETANFEFPLNIKGGSRLDILLNASTRRDLEGNIIGVIGVGQDVSLLREKESALQQAQKMEAVGQLTGGLAHDFNNLLSIIQGNLRFLQDDLGEVDNDIKLLLEDALSAVDDGTELTSRLLQFSRNRNLQPDIQGVNETIEKFYRLMIRTIGEKITVEVNLAEEELFVSVDPSQLENSLLNLSINARDAMPNGGEISITAERVGYEEAKQEAKQTEMNKLFSKEFVRVAVSDQGTGIEPSIIGRITEPFFTTKDVGAGTGLGLSMVYSFLKTSGGFLRIDSEVGEGTVVEMYFPLVKREKMPTTAAIAASSKSAFSKTILVVEDEPRVRRVTIRDLQRLNYKTIEAGNADIAVSIIKSGEKIDLVFSDILMPGDMDGRMLGDWVDEYYPEIKVVLTSGYSKGKGVVKESLSNENFARHPVIRKPYRIDELAQGIQGAFDEN
ncbi:MAG: PAS domain S-box protein, partial [Planktomarina sp.]|nr:PAS domain S-box protein [Planktomarina sp.]